MPKATSLLHTVIARLMPASGAATWVMVTVAEALVHGGKPVTVYVYTPGVDVPGS
jgi:hypothetical protein